MEIIKHYISTLCDSNLVVEFTNKTWMRIVELKGRYIWYNSELPTQKMFFNKSDECFRVIELSIKKDKIEEIVYNSLHGNVLIYKKNANKEKFEEIETNAAELLLELNKI